MTEEQIFEEFGLEPEPSSARAIVTRLQQVQLEMNPSKSDQGEHEMTLRLPMEEALDQDDPGEKYVDEADHTGNRTHIDGTTSDTTATPSGQQRQEVQEEQEVNQAAVRVSPSVPSGSGKKRRRKIPRPHWRKMTWVLIIFSALMLAWIIAGANSTHCGSKANEAARSGCEAGTGIGVGIIIFLWFLGFVVLSLIWFMTRPRGRDCPACGEKVKRGQTRCPHCGHDFAAAVTTQQPVSESGSSP